MAANHQHRFGPFGGIVRSFLGAITGAFSSLPSNPFNPKPPPPPLVPLLPYHRPRNSPPPIPPPAESLAPPQIPLSGNPPSSSSSSSQNLPISLTPHDGDVGGIEGNPSAGHERSEGSHLSLCPDMEIEESRKRSIRKVLKDDEDRGGGGGGEGEDGIEIKFMKKQKLGDAVAVVPGIGHEGTLSAPQEDLEMTCVEENPNAFPIIPKSSSSSSHMQENYDETVVVYTDRTSATKRKIKDNDDGAMAEKKTKKRRVSSPDHTPKSVSGVKRKKSEDEVGAKYEKKLKALSIDELKEEENMEEEPIPIDIQPIPEEKSIDNDDDEKLKRRTIIIHNLPLNAKKKDINKVFASYGPMEAIILQANSASSDVHVLRKRSIVKEEIINKMITSQTASIVYKEESSANAAILHNVKEFNGNYIFVDAPWCSGVPEDFFPNNRARTALLSNLPYDVKGEEVLEILHFTLPKTHIEALRVFRNASPALGASAYVLFKSEVNLRAFLSTKQTLKSKGKVVSVTHITKRQRDPGSEESRVKKKPLLYGESRPTTTTAKQSQPLLTRMRGSTIKDETPSELSKSPIHESLSGVKQKREEKRQRGISRSKKIRRS